MLIVVDGEYMVNWIQEHELGRNFKALLTHDGVFPTLAQYSSEELWFPQHDFNGSRTQLFFFFLPRSVSNLAASTQTIISLGSPQSPVPPESSS